MSNNVGFDELAIDVNLNFRKLAILLRHGYRNMMPLAIVEFLARGDQALIIRYQELRFTVVEVEGFMTPFSLSNQALPVLMRIMFSFEVVFIQSA